VTQFPGDPATAVARIIKEHHKKISRIEARLDQGESNDSKRAGDITTANTNIAAINTRLGGNTQETFLGTLGLMSHITNGSQTALGPWSDSGVLQGGPTTYWTATAADALIAWMNNVDSDISTLFSLFGDLLTELQTGKYMHP